MRKRPLPKHNLKRRHRHDFAKANGKCDLAICKKKKTKYVMARFQYK